MLPYGWERVFKKTNKLWSRVPLRRVGFRPLRQGTFQPKGEQKSLLVCPTWRWASRRQPSRIEVKNRWSAPVVWACRRGGPLHIADEIWEPTQLGGLWTLVLPASLWYSFQEGYRRIITRQRLRGSRGCWTHGWGRAPPDVCPWHHWDSPSPPPSAEAWNSRRSPSLQCPSSALYWDKLISCSLWRDALKNPLY